MGKKLYVGNLTYGVTDSDLEKMFAAHGTVESAQVIMDRDTGRSKGFGFVEMGSAQEAQAAITALNGKEVDGRALTVNEAKPRTEGGRGGGGEGGEKRRDGEGGRVEHDGDDEGFFFFFGRVKIDAEGRLSRISGNNKQVQINYLLEQEGRER